MVGTDIGPIVYEVEIDGIPEIDFIDNWRGGTGPQEVLDWGGGGFPGNLLEGDVYGKDPLMDGAEGGGSERVY